MKPRLLQVCNVGQICGGTAACAWTVTRALPGFEHEVVFLGPMAEETRRVFAPHRCHSWHRVTPAAEQGLRPDVVLLHNTSATRVAGRLSVPSIMYVHSRTRTAAADSTVYCSRWLAELCGQSPERVLWQGVPLAQATVRRDSLLTDETSLVVGRLCTPQLRKWPVEQVSFYAALAKKFPRVRWEFVGCPTSLQAAFRDACRGRARFWSAGWERRGLLTTWDVLLYHQPNLPESFGRTVAEAMRVGCVPVVDRQGGFVEQLDGGGGVLCGTFDEFAAALYQLHDPVERAALSIRARELANKHWSLAAFARRLLCLFDGSGAGEENARSTAAAAFQGGGCRPWGDGG